jgi:HSP20 family molecular chaperone IbpA
MVRSPFHGIFSTLGNSGQGKNAFPWNEETEATPEPVPSAQPSEAQPQFAVQEERSQGVQVGRIAVDIFEFEEYYIIKAPIAGVKLADLDIEVNDNVLTIRGSRKQTDDVAQEKYYLQECFWGSFARSITLPFNIDARKVKATFSKDSILKILIPKEEKVKIVRINEV